MTLTSVFVALRLVLSIAVLVLSIAELVLSIAGLVLDSNIYWRLRNEAP
ncbi:MAG: hypothetical protein AAGG48_28715 [Planctomycetota bacterium]